MSDFEELEVTDSLQEEWGQAWLNPDWEQEMSAHDIRIAREMEDLKFHRKIQGILAFRNQTEELLRTYKMISGNDFSCDGSKCENDYSIDNKLHVALTQAINNVKAQRSKDEKVTKDNHVMEEYIQNGQ